MSLQKINGGLPPDVKKGAVALYLFNHGTYHSPRLIDLQKFRIHRYIDNVRDEETAKKHQLIIIDVFKPYYVDMDVPFYHVLDGSSVPAFLKLLDDYKKGLFVGVIVDIAGGNPSSNSGVFILNSLHHLRIPYINVCAEDETVADALRLSKRLRHWLLHDSDDLLAMCPGLIHSMLNHIECLVSERSYPSRDLWDFVKRCTERQSNTQRPIKDISAIAELVNPEWCRREEEERKAVEDVIQIGFSETELWNEKPYLYERRDEESMSIILEKLKRLGFNHKKRTNVLTISKKYVKDGISYTAFADPRPVGRVNFFIYKNKETDSWRCIKSYILETWKNVDEKKLDDRIIKSLP